MGAHKNCMTAKANNKYPDNGEASLTFTCANSEIRPGITGMMTPNPIVSIKSVRKINPMAGFLDILNWFKQLKVRKIRFLPKPPAKKHQ
jgi:hypothetical protein